MRECEVAAIIDRVLDENGIIDSWFSTIVVSCLRVASLHAKTSSRKIRYGDPVIINMRPVWMGYDGCIAYTLIAGQSQYWEGIIEKVSHALSRLRGSKTRNSR